MRSELVGNLPIQLRPIAFFNGEPVDLPATPAPVTLTDEQAQEYADLQEIADKLEEVFF